MNLPIDIPSGGPGIIVDLFAGGGGASEGIRMALGRDPDLAINHDPEAVAMHAQNHPGTRHLIEDIWSVDPSWATQGKPVDLLWASPDCTHHSKAKGSAPNRDDKRRSLACVITDKWIPACWPETIIMENVEEFTSWGPLDCEGRVIQAAKGDTFRWFLRRLRRFGYRVEYRELRACDYGAPTIRKRLFLIAKRNKGRIVWPEPTHGPGMPEPYRTAADCIDWSLPCPSIFDRKKPLADATLRRIAKGIMRYVVQAERPFIVNLTHGGRLESIDDPIRTITCANRGEKALVVPVL
ncbi:MAG: DNA cytosine methyltransferase, partial [Desulfomicrobium apsheronum]|nr:DNA cytosine methyltransferase [Desulfomicrobium apsheronum]